MFLAADNSTKPKPAAPEGGGFSESDWKILSGFWHPVAFEHEVGDAPVAATLLDVNIVLFRSGGEILVARDLCPHRGAKLSMGRLEDGLLVCPMHGLHFDGAGRCVKIPSVASPGLQIPARLDLKTYMSHVRYGLVWVCLSGEPIWPMPEWPEIEAKDAGLEKIFIPPGEWAAAASRETENFMDVAHHPFVHVKTFGNPGRPAIDPHDVTETDYGLRLDLSRYEIERGWHDPEREGERLTDYRYELTFPFAKALRTEGREDGIVCWFYDVGSPVSARRTRIFQINLTSHLYCSREEYPAYQIVTNEEDRACVEGQRPEDLPLDPKDELHIPADRGSLAYRRALAKKFGLGAPMSA